MFTSLLRGGSRQSAGRPLDPATRVFAATRFRHDFSRVRVHADADANRLSHDLGADAFTVGTDIYFGAGLYAPGSRQGRLLLAHELAHTVQNDRARSENGTNAWLVNQPAHPAEREAEHAARQAVSADAEIQIRQRPGAVVQRQPKESKQKVDMQKAARDAFLKELAKWPNKAHLHWKRLTSMERFAVAAQMGLYYGDEFARQFAKATETGANLSSIHYGPGFPEHSHKYFQERGYRLAQTGAGLDSIVEWWVHPTGKVVMKVRDLGKKARPSQSPPAPVQQTPPPTPDDSKQLLDLALDLLRGSIAESTKLQTDLEGQKKRLGQQNKTTPAYKKDFDRYMKGLKDMGKFVDSQVDSMNVLRESLKGGGDVDRFDLVMQELNDLRIWVDVESSDPMLFGLKPLDVDIKDYDDEDEDE